MRRILFICAAGCVLPAFALDQAQRTVAPVRTVTVDHCMVSPLTIDGEADVPAQEAGVIKRFKVGELDQVEENALLATIDDALSRKQLKNATAEFNAAKQKAESDIDIRVAKAAADTAWFEWQKNLEAVNGTPSKPATAGKPAIPAKLGVPGSVADVELKRLEFQFQRANLAIEQGRKDQIVNAFTRDAKEAEVESAQEQIIRREVRAPFAGVVQKIFPHKGEWVKPGDPVMRIIRMDRLQVAGYLELGKYNPGDVRDCEVTIKVTLAGGKEFSFPGKIVYVDLEVQREREYMIRAEVTNRQENNEWLLRPGLSAKMEIQSRLFNQLAARN